MEMGEYPIYMDGAAAGTLEVHGEGLMTVFTAELPGREGIVRLSVFGGGREGYLGVMAPAAGALRLTRRLSAADMRGFPEKIEYAAPRGRARAPACPPPETPPAAPSAPSAVPPETEGLLWFSTPEGVLTAFDGTRTLTAIPADAARPPRGLLRRINGREYLVFPGAPRRK
jgi:hypothetical protein